LKNLVDTWLRQELNLLPESLVPPRQCRKVCIEIARTRKVQAGRGCPALGLPA